MKQETKLLVTGALMAPAFSAYAQGGAPGGSVTWIVAGAAFAGGFLGALLACWLACKRDRGSKDDRDSKK